MNRIVEWFGKIFRKVSGKQEGAALIVTLLVMMVLVLLGLSLMLQSQTEFVIAVNEQDAIMALGYGESVMDWLNNIVIDYASLPDPPKTDLDELLFGPDATDGTADDNMPDLSWSWPASLGPVRTLDTSLTDPDDLDASNEQDTAILHIADWDGAATNSQSSEQWMFFRMGSDSDADGDWDGPRAEVHVKWIDNYDTNTTIPPDNDDDDWRMRANIMVDYPVFVDGSGNRITENHAPRGVARRRLVARFAPAGHTAIRTDGDLDISGSLEVCGECGGVHANETLVVGGDIVVCAEATASQGLTFNPTDPTTVRGGGGITSEVFIPVINPYHERWIPHPDVFFKADEDTTFDPIECPGPNVPNWDWTKDPGATKYFAIVLKQVAGSAQILVFKAYWDSTKSWWAWRLIDDLTDLNNDLTLDNCGRVVAGTVNIGGTDYVLDADPFPADGDVYWDGTTTAGNRPVWTGVGVTNSGVNEFYGFQKRNGGPGQYNISACSADDTLTGTYNLGKLENDFSHTNCQFIHEGVTNILWNLDSTLSPADYSVPSPSFYANVPLLPNGQGSDTIVDFKYQNVMDNGKGIIDIDIQQEGVAAPVWGSIVFFNANITMSGTGNPDFKYVDSIPAQNTDNLVTDLAERWRIAMISTESIDQSGNPIYGPPSTDYSDSTSPFPVTFIAGRDIELSGTGGAGHGNQGQCPDNIENPAVDCNAAPPNPAGYEGMILAHEEIDFTGNVTIDGFIIAEDAALCASVQADDSEAGGSVEIHYDCNNPPDPWGNRSVRLVGWEEVQ